MGISMFEAPPQAVECFGNVPEDPSVDETVRYLDVLYFGYITLPIVSFGLPLACAYFCAVAKAMNDGRVSKKCYSFILARTMADMIACSICIVLAILTLHAPVNVSYAPIDSDNNTMILETILIGSVWSAMVTYVTLSLMKLYAVMRPLSFRREVTLRRCLWVIKISWFFYVTLVIVMLAFSFALRSASVAKSFHCDNEEDCLRMLNQIRVLIHCTVVLFCYVATLTSFGITIFYIKFYRTNFTSNLLTPQSKIEVDHQINQSMRFSTYKLCMHIGTFMLVSVVHCIYSSIQVFHTDRCLYQHKKVEMFNFYCISRTLILLRIILDPIVSLSTDYKIRRSLFELLQMPVEWCQRRLHSRYSGADDQSTKSESDVKHSNLTNSDTTTDTG